jgi:hypothetical protein
MRMSDIKETVVSKIRKLLALGASSPNQHEASLALERAHEFMQKHNLSMLDVTDEKSDMIELECDSSMRMRLWVEDIHEAMAKLNYCYMFFHTKAENSFDGKRIDTVRTILIIGKKDNAQTARLMAEWLIGVCDSVCKELLREDRNPYRQGFAEGINDQVDEIVRKEAENKDTTALVVVRDEAEKHALSLYNFGKPLPRKDSTYNNAFYEARERGRNFNLNRQIKGDNTK